MREVRKLHPKLPVILSSGFNEVEAIRRFQGKGLSGFVQKPYTAATLAERVKEVLTGRAVNHTLQAVLGGVHVFPLPALMIPTVGLVVASQTVVAAVAAAVVVDFA